MKNIKIQERHGALHIVKKTKKGSRAVYNLDALNESGRATVYTDGKKTGVIRKKQKIPKPPKTLTKEERQRIQRQSQNQRKVAHLRTQETTSKLRKQLLDMGIREDLSGLSNTKLKKILEDKKGKGWYEQRQSVVNDKGKVVEKAIRHSEARKCR